MIDKQKPQGMRTFIVIWFGQLVSTLGSGLTGFALGIWLYMDSGSTTLFALNMLAFAVPNLVVSPFAGALVDRFDRRLVLIFSDAGAGLSTAAVALLFFTGNLEYWHIFIATAVNSACSAFQWPAHSAATTMLVPKAQLGRAGGMVQIGEAISQLIAPAAAGFLLVTTGLLGILIIDAVTWLIAIGTLLFVRIPSPPKSEAAEAARGSIFKEAVFGWRYITGRAGLFGLLIVFASTNFLNSLTGPLLAPLVLSMTTPDVMGYLASGVGVGMLIGTLVMSAWGGPKRRIYGILGFLMLQGVFLMLLGLRPSLLLMAVAGFGLMFCMPIVNGCSQALWQTKVPPDLQGRVFAVRRMIAWSVIPLAYVLAGPLNDFVFNPLLAEGGALASSVGLVIGVGPGRGTGLMFILVGLLTMLVVLWLGWLNPRVRNVEVEIPDGMQEEPKEEALPGGVVPEYIAGD
jgi:MFS transporter, DHA3 family, macrolide efflux protein